MNQIEREVQQEFQFWDNVIENLRNSRTLGPLNWDHGSVNMSGVDELRLFESIFLDDADQMETKIDRNFDNYKKMQAG